MQHDGLPGGYISATGSFRHPVCQHRRIQLEMIMAEESTGGSNRRRGTGRRPAASQLPQSDPQRQPFLPEVLDRTVIAIPLLNRMKEERDEREKNPRHPAGIYHVIIDLNLEYPGGREKAREKIRRIIDRILQGDFVTEGIDDVKSSYTDQYLFAELSADTIQTLVRMDGDRNLELTDAEGEKLPTEWRALYRIWPDFKVQAFVTKSISTVKANAAQLSFSANGENIVWAVLDSGIEGNHPHFRMHGNLEIGAPLMHCDFTIRGEGAPLKDEFGHGTHVAGIIAGEAVSADEYSINAVSRHRDEDGEVSYVTQKFDRITGMAPKAKLVSLKVLDSTGGGRASNLIAALAYIQEVNGYGRRLRIHGVNMSVGYDFEPEWFACGQSPLCVEVDRLVKSGVSVVVAAGNTGYGYQNTAFRGAVAAGMDLTINDPGNAELAITVGATHRDMPHVYGVSYFSSKGPTGDGRPKPDLVAPGEKIISCAAGSKRNEVHAKIPSGPVCDYREESGTSMAAPHVSGVIAAFLSVRQEFIGRPEQVKEIFLSTATDLKRDRYFQGYGLVDLMRAIQSV